MNAVTLSVNLHQAVKDTYTPAAKMSKQAKTLPVLHYARIFTHDGRIVIQTVDTSGDKWELNARPADARIEQEFDVCVPMKAFKDWLSVTAKYKSVLDLSLDGMTLIVTEKYGEKGAKLPCASRARFNCLSSAEFPSNLPVKL